MIQGNTLQDVRTVPDLQGVQGVLGRRLVAWLVDLVVVAVLGVGAAAVLAVLGLVTFGLGWALLAVLPAWPLAYSFGFLALRGATPGQSLLGLAAVHHATGAPPTPVEALVSTAVYALVLTAAAPLMLLALVTPRHRAPQDLLAGLLIVRRAPLTGASGVWNMSRGPSAV